MIEWHAKMAAQRLAGRTVASIAAEWRYSLAHTTRVLRKQGVPPGRNPRKHDADKERKAKEMRSAGLSWGKIALALECSRSGVRCMVAR